jgi:hypothetical protein
VALGGLQVDHAVDIHASPAHEDGVFFSGLGSGCQKVGSLKFTE